MKIHKNAPGKISFLKDQRAVVETMAMKKVTGFWNQRRRWASKIVYTLSAFTVSISIVAWLVHVLLFIQFLNVFIHAEILFLFLPLAMKTISEWIFLRKTGTFLNEKFSGFVIISAQLLYCLYISCIGLLAPFGKYNWKGRRLR
jgi:cellulose synthase/poly-beta-1,6-N-acetylglucosamine synthase-like glycosyltransferase